MIFLFQSVTLDSARVFELALCTTALTPKRGPVVSRAIPYTKISSGRVLWIFQSILNQLFNIFTGHWWYAECMSLKI